MFSRILIVEDEPDTIEWLRDIVMATCPDAMIDIAETQASAIKQLQSKAFDLVLLDLYLPDGDGETILTRIHRMGDMRPAVILSTIESRPSRINPSLSAGVDGLVLKDCADEELPQAIASVAKGEAIVSPRAARSLLSLMATPAPSADERSKAAIAAEKLELLTERERDVFVAIALGLSRAAIAQKLSISTNTVATHLRSIYRKLEISSRAEIGVLAAEADLLDE